MRERKESLSAMGRREFLNLSFNAFIGLLIRPEMGEFISTRYTPPSLMMHSANMPLVAPLSSKIKEKYTPLTYKEYSDLVFGRRDGL